MKHYPGLKKKNDSNCLKIVFFTQNEKSQLT